MTETAPTTTNRTLLRLPNTAYRSREYLTEAEVTKLIDAARKRGRNGLRDSAAILLAYRHGLRAQEHCQLRWSQIDLRHGRLHVNRVQGRPGGSASLARTRTQSVTSSARREPVCVRDRRWDARHNGLVLEDASAHGQGREATVHIRICCGMPAATSSRTTGMIRGRWPTTSGIGICNRRRGTLR